MVTINTTIEIPEAVIQQIANKVSWTVMTAIRSLEQTDSKDIMGVPELADYLGVSKRWVYDRTNEKSIPHFKVSSVLKFRRKEIDMWLDTYHVPVVKNPPKLLMNSQKERNRMK